MIHRRRHNTRPHTDQEIRDWIDNFQRGNVTDYQMSAWLMACCFQSLTPRETATLTRCLTESGMVLEWPNHINVLDGDNGGSSHDGRQNHRRRPRLVDKHSSGGVGDKVSLILTPLVVAAAEAAGVEVAVPMMAGRGLGHTGGTIDKLESLKGFNAAHLTVQDFQRIVVQSNVQTKVGTMVDNDDSMKHDHNHPPVQPVGCAIVSQSSELCPVDQRLYALRDVTATVSCLALQTASIMSKKIAENPDSIVLDVKYGHGAFQSTREEAQELAESMVAVGEANGLNPTTAFLTKMEYPIGNAVGNWLEVRECIHVMAGGFAVTPSVASRGQEEKETSDAKVGCDASPPPQKDVLRLSRDLIALVIVQAGQMLYQSVEMMEEDENNENGRNESTGPRRTLEEWMEHAYQVLDSGAALDKFRQMALAQQADAEYLDLALNSPDEIPLATFVAIMTIKTAGYVWDIPAKTVGEVSVMVGAGRMVAGQEVDAQAGVLFSVQVGDAVAPGQVVLQVYSNQSQAQANAALSVIEKAIQIEDFPPPFTTESLREIVTHRVTKTGTGPFVLPDYL